MTTLPRRSIRSLYSIALCEGEGVGTAYEYFVKRLLLGRWVEKMPGPARVLIAGLPEKYGTGLDSILFASDIGASEAVVIDEREAALAKSRRCVDALRASGELRGMSISHALVADLATPDGTMGTFDLCFASEVLQRLGPAGRADYLRCLIQQASALALFVPNADNDRHRALSGLAGVSIRELQLLTEAEGMLESCDYIDMPPWPPGLVQSQAQRDQMAARRMDSLAMLALEQYARLEKLFPAPWRKRHAHIIYALVRKIDGTRP